MVEVGCVDFRNIGTSGIIVYRLPLCKEAYRREEYLLTIPFARLNTEAVISRSLANFKLLLLDVKVKLALDVSTARARFRTNFVPFYSPRQHP